MSFVLERPVQKYFSGLKPTKLINRALSYLHDDMEKERDERYNCDKINKTCLVCVVIENKFLTSKAKKKKRRKKK